MPLSASLATSLSRRHRLLGLAAILPIAALADTLPALDHAPADLSPTFDPAVLGYEATLTSTEKSLVLYPRIDDASRRLHLRDADGTFRQVSPGATLAAGRHHLIALRDDGSVVAWGESAYGLITIPTAATSDVVAVAAGEDFNLALKTDGSVHAWGDLSPALATIPPDAQSGVVAIAAGEDHALALRGDGSVVGWGENQAADIPEAALSGIVAIAAGQSHSLALTDAGAVIAWGYGTEATSVPSAATSGVVAIAAGSTYSLALKSDGALVTWGTLSTYSPYDTGFPPASLTRVAGMAAGTDHIATLRDDGSVLIWGPNTPIPTTIPTSVTDAVAIVVGENFAAALKPDGTLVVWGASGAPALTVPVAASGLRLPASSRLPIPAGTGKLELRVTAPGDVSPDRVPVAAGTDYSTALDSDGAPRVWGGSVTAPPSAPGGTTGLVALAAGSHHTLGLRADGSVVSWGSSPAVPTSLADLPTVAIAAAGKYSVALSRTGAVTTWDSSASPSGPPPVGPQTDVLAIAAGASHFLALRHDGSVVAWGSNSHGQITVPTAAQSGVVAIAAGTYHSVALKSDRTLLVWGKDNTTSGEPTRYILPLPAVRLAAGTDFTAVLLGDGSVGLYSASTTYVPVLNNIPSAALTGAGDLVTGPAHVTVFKTDGSIVSWGNISTTPPAPFDLLRSGPPGTAYTIATTRAAPSPALADLRSSGGDLAPAFAPDTTAYSQTLPSSTRAVTLTPTPLEPLAGLDVSVNGGPVQRLALGATLDGGSNFNVGLTPRGAALVWGSAAIDLATIPAAAQSGVTAIAAGYSHALALKSDGTLVTWGNVPDPLRPSALVNHDVAAIAAGYDFSAALKHDGSVFTWGSAAPEIPLEARSGVTAIAAGRTHLLALKSDGSVISCGYFGVPTPESVSSGVTAIAAGRDFSLALKSDGSVIAWGTSSNGLNTPPASIGTRAVAIAAGHDHALVLLGDGSLVTWGPISPHPLATIPTSATRVIAIAAGEQHSSALREDGSVVTWGYLSTQSSHADIRLAAPRHARLPLRGGANLIRLRTTAAGGIPLAATPLVAGRDRNWVLDHLGQFDFRRATTSSFILPSPPTNTLGNSVALASGGLGDYSVRFDGTIATLRGTTPPSDLTSTASPGGSIPRPRAIRVAVAQNHAIALLEDRTLRAWGSSTTIPSHASTEILAIAAGRDHLLALRANGTVATWSHSLSSSHSVLQIPSAAQSGVVAIAGGENFSLALKLDGSLVAWGENFSVLNNIPADADFATIAAGDRHAVALRRDGTVVAWGENFAGQTTVPPSAQSGVAWISATANHTLALKTDGSVVAWGGNVLPPLAFGLLTAPARTYTLTATRAPASPALASLASSTGDLTPAFDPATLSYTQTVPYAAHAARLAATAAEPGQLQLRVNGAPFRLVTQGPSLALGQNLAIGITPGGGAFSWWGSGSLTTIPVAAQSDLTAIAAGSSHILALRADGSPVTWGSAASPSTLAIPSSAQSGIAAIAARGPNSLALRRDGTIVGWGDAYFINSPPLNLGSDNLVIALGTGHALALKTDGSVISWGSAPTPPPEAAADVVAIAAGSGYSLALKADGSVLAWGGSSQLTTVPTAAQSGVIAIAAGESHALALRADGGLVTWGENGSSVLTIPPTAPVNVVAIAAGRFNSAVLKADGSVVQWGDIGYSPPFRPVLATPLSAALTLREGPNRIDLRVTPAPTKPIHEATLAAGQYHNLLATPDGAALPWAVTTSGSPFGSVPTAAQAGVSAVYTGGNRLLALRHDGAVVSLSGTYVPFNLQPGYAPDPNLPIPARAIALAVGLSSSETLTLRADGSVFAWQNDSAVPASARTGVAAIAANPFNQLFAVRTDGRLVKWNTSGGLDLNLPAATQRDVIAVAATENHGLVLKTDGTLFAWHLGSPALTDTLTQIPAGATGIVALAAAQNHFIVLKRDGTVFAWGFESTLNTIPPAAQTGVVAIAAGPAHALALRADGTVIPWGRSITSSNPLQSVSAAGLLADPIRTYSLVVERALGAPGLAHLAASVGDLTPDFAPDTLAYTLPATPYTTLTLPGLVRAPLGRIETRVGSAPFATRLPGPTVAVSQDVVLALTPAGAVQAFGTGFITPVPAAAQTEVIAIAAARQHAVALKQDGRLVAWGSNSYGALNIPGGQDYVAVTAADTHSLALTSAGGVVAWGQNFSQQLLVPAAATTEVVAIAAGETTSMALRRDGSVVAWGRGSTSPQTIPADAQSDVIAIAAGSYHFLALRSDGRVVEWGSLPYPTGSAPTHGIVAITAHGDQNLALHADGQIFSWGSPVAPPDLPLNTPADLATLTLGYSHGAALRPDGSLFAFNRFGRGASLSQHNNTPTFAGPFALPLSARQPLDLGANTIELRFTRFDETLPALSYEIGVTRLPTPSIRIEAVRDFANPFFHDFGLQGVGIPSAPQLFTLRNTGTADLIVNGISLPGPNADFAVSGLAFPLTLAPDAETTFTTTFTPGGTNRRIGFIVLDANVPPRSTESFTFLGQGVSLPAELASWRAGRFTAEQLADPELEATVWGDLADPDGDGLPNLLEYALALDPRAASSAPAASVTEDPADPETPPVLTLTYTRLKRAVAAGLVYRIEVSDTLAAGSWTPAGVTESIVASDATTETVAAGVPADAPARFLRLRVTAP